MSFVVNNTTFSHLLNLICPHTCRNCGQLGEVLCECCKKNLINQHQPICPICKQIVAKPPENVKNTQTIFRGCPDCETPFWGLWSFGWREGTLEKLVEEYKYQSIRAMGPILADFLDACLPSNLPPMVIVPLPTIGKHVRERGLDHTLTLTKRLAHQRHWSYQQLLGRAANTVQVGAKIADRKTQAAKAYTLTGKVDPKAHYLLLDDVWTTGSTMLSAAKVLQNAGAKQISAAVLAISRSKTA